MQNQLLEELSEECVCPLCLEIFDKPRLLPDCGHCFCDRCLRHYAQSKNTMKLDCPLCKKPFTRDIDSLKIHLQLQNICDKLKKLNIPQNLEQNIVPSSNDKKESNTSTTTTTTTTTNENNQNPIQEIPPAFNPEAIDEMQDENQSNINPQQYMGMNNQQHPPYNVNFQQNQPIQNNPNNQMYQYNYHPNVNNPQQQNSFNPLVQQHQQNGQQGNVNQIQQQMYQYGYNINQNNNYNPNNNYNNNMENPQQNNLPNNNLPVNNNNLQEDFVFIPEDQPGYIIQDQDEVSMIKSNIKKEQQKKREEEGKGFWGNLASFFKGTDLNFREGCGEFECLYNDFVIEKEEVPTLVEKWFENLWFKPVGFSKAATVQSSSCVQALFPFRLFEITTKTYYDGQVFYNTQKNKKQKSRYTSGYINDVHRVLVFTSSQHHNVKKWVNQQKISLTQDTTFKPQPFNNIIEGKICYPSFNYESAWEEARQIVDYQVRSQCESHARMVNSNVTTVSLSRVNTDYTRIRSQVVYFPLYLIQYNYNNELFHCVVNGITGEVTGDRKYGTGVVGEIVSKGWSFISGLFGGSGNNNNNNNNNN